MTCAKDIEAIDFKLAPWTEIDAALIGYDAKVASRDYVLGNGLIDIDERRIWKEAGFASFVNYVEVRLGWDPHTTNERKRTAKALKALPLLSAEMREGRIRYSHVREITRSANAENEQEWIDWSRGKTAYQVWMHTKVRGPNKSPRDRPDPTLFTMPLKLECDAEEWAFFCNLIDEVRRTHGDAGKEMDAAQCLKLAYEGKSNVEVHATFCPSCLEGGVMTRGELVPLTATTIEKYLCEGRVIAPDGTVVTRHIPSDVLRAALHRARGTCEVPYCRHRWFVNVHHLKLFSEGGTHALSNLVVLCAMHHGLIHSGVMWILGDRETGMTFTHADGTRIGDVPNQTLAEAFQTAFHALRDSGIPEGLVREALEEVRGGHHRTAERILEAVAPVIARLVKKRNAEKHEGEVAAEAGFQSHVGLFSGVSVPVYGFVPSHVGREVAMVS